MAFETALGGAVIIGALVLVGKCLSGDPATSEPAARAPCETDLDCRIRANTDRMAKSCATAAQGERHAADREFDLARGLRTGAMSAGEVRQAAAELDATRRYGSEARADCEAARAEAQRLGDEAVAFVKARDKAAAKAAAANAPKAEATAKPKKPAAKRKPAPKPAAAAAPPPSQL